MMIAGALNALYEIIFVSIDNTIFKDSNPLFFDPKVSWKNKWSTNYPEKKEKKWYYFGVYPRYKERFPYSSTILVFLTDAWHLFKALMLTFIMASVVLYTPIFNPVLDFFILYSGFTFSFTIFYEYIFRK